MAEGGQDLARPNAALGSLVLVGTPGRTRSRICQSAGVRARAPAEDPATRTKHVEGVVSRKINRPSAHLPVPVFPPSVRQHNIGIAQSSES